MELKQFPRIQTVTFTQNDFDGIQHFPECGGIGIFIGTVRNHHQGKAVKALKYTAYAPVAEKMIRQIEQEIQLKYGVSYVRVVHRIGALDIGDTAIIAMAYAAHRREAFHAFFNDHTDHFAVFTFGPNHCDISEWRVRNPHFCTIQYIMIAFVFNICNHPRRV